MLLAITAAVLAGAIAGCGGGGGGSSSTPASGNLAQAAAYVPGGAGSGYTFEFADWSAIERQLAITPAQLASGKASSAFFARLNGLAAVPGSDSPYDLAPAAGHRLWSAANVTWDAAVTPTGSGPSLNMTGFLPQFDLAGVGRRLAGCGYTTSKVGAASVYSGSTLTMAKCAGPFGDQIPTYTAFGIDSADHTVLGSDSATAITAALRAHKTISTLAPVLGQLQHDQAVAVGVGPGFCSELSNPAFFAGRTATPALVSLANKTYPPAKPYVAFGFGVAFSNTDAHGQIVFTYADPAAAQSDLADRRHRLSSGKSLAVNLPYSRLVRLVSGRAAGQSVVLDVAQPAGRPIQVAKMFLSGDLGFARCG
jgi:hypothetical protein